MDLDRRQGRMLLAHNFALTDKIVPEISRDAFAAIFLEGLGDRTDIKGRALTHAHWMVEILFDLEHLEPQQVGEICAAILAETRKEQKVSTKSSYDLLVLAGQKQTPATRSDPETLKTGEWGVDVVETESIPDFLTSIGWQEENDRKPTIFRVEVRI
ncbi:DUF2656 family protein [Roseofilum reptotaenium CS-1145]|uniref:DUF2656 domain-containing protein n=1 Tax=Roseofilum reptotaenium AO1-A TaxID=1925591 RepID=A0A1L9QQL3_9CYAN|nr:DUF2656 family protein [Roseofilum reptotaenium]MDB9516205.1 DUF2656 family protein [Roseofilum reptotaenium CS-1145]OJJ24933.1 hypothetical protein BI308_13695 [Roseofilum reptotaenium AO1-A]